MVGLNQRISKQLVKVTTRLRWLQLWICIGLALAVALWVTSISTYLAVSRSVIMAHLRGDLHSRAALIEDRTRQTSVQTKAQLLAVLEQSLDKSNGSVAWIRVQNREGETIAAAGSSASPTFSTQEIRGHLRSHEPLFKRVGRSKSSVLVEMLPFLLPSELRPVQAGYLGDGPPASIEIAEVWTSTNVTLGAVRRHLLIDSSAALALLFALAIIGLRVRSYLRGLELANEIEIARSVQRDLLPAAKSSLDVFEVAGHYLPVAGMSGDFYDVFSLPCGRVCFVLGDVAGKGVPAAMLMGVLQGAVRSSSWMESASHHCKATQNINRLLCERTAANRFATMFWSYFDPHSQHLKFVNSGHCPPLLVKTTKRNPILRLQTGGPVLGLISGVRFEQGSVPLDVGDRLILYSDGIVEATNASGEEFGEDRLMAVVGSHADETAEPLRDTILRALDAFTGTAPQQDDRTLVVTVYRGHALGSEAVEMVRTLATAPTTNEDSALAPAAA